MYPTLPTQHNAKIWPLNQDFQKLFLKSRFYLKGVGKSSLVIVKLQLNATIHPTLPTQHNATIGQLCSNLPSGMKVVAKSAVPATNCAPKSITFRPNLRKGHNFLQIEHTRLFTYGCLIMFE